MKVSEGVARPVRGLGQGGAGYLIVDLADEFTAWEPTTRQYGLAVLAVGAIVSFIQNTGENRGWFRPVLRTVPPTTAEVLDEKVDPDPPAPAAPPAPAPEAPEQSDNTPKDDDDDLGLPADEFAGEMR